MVAPPQLDPSEQNVLVTAAVRAVSPHDTQPWLFRFVQRTVEVFRDPRREPWAEDPRGLRALVGIGAAVFNLRVAAASLGRDARIHLLPDASQPTLAARVTLGAEPGGRVDLATLFPYLSRRRVHGELDVVQPIPSSVRRDLEKAAQDEGAALEWVEKLHRLHWLRELLVNARRIAHDAEGQRRVGDEPPLVGETAAPGPTWPATSGGRVPSFAAEREQQGAPEQAGGTPPEETERGAESEPPGGAERGGEAERRAQGVEEGPAVAILASPSDEPMDVLRAGQALQRVVLVAGTHGLATSSFDQPLENPDLRWLVRDPHSAWSASQAILLFGYGPEVPAGPGRPAGEFVLTDADQPPTGP